MVLRRGYKILKVAKGGVMLIIYLKKETCVIRKIVLKAVFIFDNAK